MRNKMRAYAWMSYIRAISLVSLRALFFFFHARTHTYSLYVNGQLYVHMGVKNINVYSVYAKVYVAGA